VMMKPMPKGSDLSPLFEERERVNGEEGVIGGGGVAGEELSMIMMPRVVAEPPLGAEGATPNLLSL
jgi:hypothetical protein